MPQPNAPDSPEASPADTSFGDILTQFEQTHHAGGERVEGTVVSVTPDGVFVDIGRKMDGMLPPAPELKPGTKVIVSIRGRVLETLRFAHLDKILSATSATVAKD